MGGHFISQGGEQQRICCLSNPSQNFPGDSDGRVCLQCRRPGFNPWVGKIPWRRAWLLTPVFLGFPSGSDSKESACNAGDLGLISGLGRSPGKGKGYPLQYSGLENSMDCIVHEVAENRTQLSDFHFQWKPEFVTVLLSRLTGSLTVLSINWEKKRWLLASSLA